MYRVKVFKTCSRYSEEFEKEINDFLIGNPIEVVNCKLIEIDGYMVYIIMYQVW